MDTQVEPINPDSQPAQESTSGALDARTPGGKTDVQTAASSPATGDQQPKSIQEALKQVKPESVQGGTGEDGQDGDSPLDPDHEGSEANADGAAPQEDEQGEATAEADRSLNLPFTKRPEWQGLLKLMPEDKKSEVIKTIRPVFEQAQALSVEVRQLKPKAAVADEFRQYAGDEQGFQTMRHIVRAYAVDPASSVPILEQMLQDARERAGLVVTDADLKQRLDDGELDERTAIELQTARVGAKSAQARAKQTEQSAVSQRQAQAQQETMRALNEWEERIRGQDTAFGDVTDDADPKHGESVADQVFDAIRLLQLRQPQAGKAELLAEAERVHRLARGRLANVRGAQRKVITSGSSSITARPEPKTMREALNGVRRERG